MAKVNLLPDNLKIKKKNFHFPVFPILFYFYLLLFVVFIILKINVVTQRHKVEDIKIDLSSVQIKSLEAGKVRENIFNMKMVLDGVALQTIFPKYSLTLILDRINKIIPRGIWLKEIIYHNTSTEGKLIIKGFAKPMPGETMITSIDNFNNDLKESFQELLFVTPEGLSSLLPQEDDVAAALTAPVELEIDFSVNTKRRQAEKIEITEFTTEFTL